MFDVLVDHVAGGVVDVGVGRCPGRRQAGGLVEAGWGRHAVAAQYVVGRRGRQAHVICDACRAPAPGEAKFDDAVLGAPWSVVRAGGRSAAADGHG